MEELTVPAVVFVEIFQISSVSCQSVECYVSHFCTYTDAFFLSTLA